MTNITSTLANLLEQIDLLKLMFLRQTGLFRLKFLEIVGVLRRTLLEHTSSLQRIGLLEWTSLKQTVPSQTLAGSEREREIYEKEH